MTSTIRTIAQELEQLLPPGGARLSEIVDRLGRPDVYVLRAALALAREHRAYWRGPRLCPAREAV